jgi:hypothetical protein
MKIITVMGTKVESNETISLHTSICQCGERVVRAKNQKSLNYYTGNEKYKAKCCKSMLEYVGEMQYVGDEMLDPTELVKETVEAIVQEAIAQEEPAATEAIPEIKSIIPRKKSNTLQKRLEQYKDLDKTGLVLLNKKGLVDNFAVFTAIEKHIQDADSLSTIETTYPLQFSNVVRYLKKDVRNNLTIIFPEFASTAPVVGRGELDSTGLVEIGQYGITKTQVFNALRNNIEDRQNLKLIYDTYPELVMGNIKYMKKAEQDILQEIL